MNDHAALTKARWAECHRRLSADGIAPAQWAFHDARVMQQVLSDEQAGLWSPFPTEDVPAANQPDLAPAASVSIPAPAAAPVAAEARARSLWSKAVTEANRELGVGEPAPPADPQDDATTTAQIIQPAGSVAKSRAAWGAATAAANADLIRRSGKVSEG